MLDGKAIDVMLERAALRYLERFDSSSRNLRRVLGRTARTLLNEGATQELVSERIDELLLRYETSGLLDDARYAAAAARGFRDRGLGKRAIAERLRAKGVASEDIEQALRSVDRDSHQPELEAARRYAKRRRLGRHRSAPQTSATRRKDLQALARAGFSYGTAQQALELDADAEGTAF